MRRQVPPAGRLRIARGILAAFFCWAFLSGLHLAGTFEVLDLKFLDWSYRLSGERRASDEIALVEIDDATVRSYPRWPIPRDQYALLLVALEEAGARAIGVDLLFLGPDGYDPRYDRLLAGVSSEYGNIVHAVSFQSGMSVPSVEGSAPSAFAVLERHSVADHGLRLREAAAVSMPFPDLSELAPALGHVNVAVDKDGAIRRVPHFVMYRGRLYPSLSLRLAGIAAGDSALPEARPGKGSIEVAWRSGRRWLLPVDREGATHVDFAGDRSSFAHTYSLIDVLRWVQAGARAKLAHAFEGRIVLLGNTAIGEAATDLGATPFENATPLLYVHANALDSFLHGRSLGPAPLSAVLFALFALSVLLGWLFVALPLPWAAAVMGGTVAVTAAASWALFAGLRMIAPTTLSLLLPPVSYATIASYRFIFLEGKARERERELQVARQIQQRLLPAEPPETPDLDVYGVNISAQEVGGDYYDWIPIGDRHLAVAVADVSGKGVAASLLMSHLRASLHAMAQEGVAPRTMAETMHGSLFRATEPGKFATCFLALISRSVGVDVAGGANELIFVNAGHNPGFLVHDGAVEPLESTGLPLGLFDPSPYDEERRRFDPGDTLFLYSDGVTECVWRNALYGEDRLLELVGRLAKEDLTARAIGEAVLADIRSFAHDDLRSDDVTILVVRRRASSPTS